MSKVYMVEDDDNIRDLVSYTLGTSGFSVMGFECSEEFWLNMKSGLPDLVLLDIMLPGEDGISILSALKSDRKTKDLPVIMLTAKDSEYDKIKGLDLGADDYIAKPFSVLELISRIRAVLRRTQGQSEDGGSFVFGSVELCSQKHTVKVKSENVVLTLKEFDLLQLLMENAGYVLTRDRIMSAIWGTDFEGETRTVDMHIKTLRKKLGADGDIIETVRGVGYKIGDPV